MIIVRERNASLLQLLKRGLVVRLANELPDLVELLLLSQALVIVDGLEEG